MPLVLCSILGLPAVAAAVCISPSGAGTELGSHPRGEGELFLVLRQSAAVAARVEAQTVVPQLDTVEHHPPGHPVRERPVSSTGRTASSLDARVRFSPLDHRLLGDALRADPGIRPPEGAPELPDDTPDRSRPAPSRPYARTDKLTYVVLGFGALHHVDHILRGNHSGWPFTSRVTPFSYSLAIYPLVGAAYLADAGPLAFIAIDAAGTAGLLLSHSLLEPPRDQYEPWADGSNRLGIEAPVVGRLAQAASVGLSLALGAHLVSSVLDGREYGFTWRRSTSEDGRAWRFGPPVLRPDGGLAWSVTVPL